MRHCTRCTSHHNRFNRSRSHSCSHRYRSHSQSNSQRSPLQIISQNIHTGAHLTTDTETHIVIDRINHTGDLHCREPLPHILEIPVGLSHVPHTELPIWYPPNPPRALTGHPGKTRIRNIKKSPFMTPHLIITVLMNHPVSQMRI